MPDTPEQNTPSEDDISAVSQGLDEVAPPEQEAEKVLAPTEPVPEHVVGDKQEPKEAPPKEEPPPPLEAGKKDLPEAEVTVPEKPSESDEEFEKKLAGIEAEKGAHPNIVKAITKSKELAQQERERSKVLEAEKNKAIEELKKARILTPEMEEKLKEAEIIIHSEHPETTDAARAQIAEISQLSTKALEILVSEGMKEDVAEFITKSGGIVAMATSGKMMPNGSQTEKEWVNRTILPKMDDGIQKRRLENLITKGMDKQDSLAKTIEEERQTAPRRAEEKQKEIAGKFNTSVAEAIKELGADAQLWDIPKDATDEDKKRIETHNKRVGAAGKKFQEYAATGQDPEIVGKMMVDASHAYYLRESNKELREEIEALKKEGQKQNDRINKIKGSGSTARPTNAPNPKISKIQPDKMMTEAQAFDVFMKDNPQ